jgi:hypothetical protein
MQATQLCPHCGFDLPGDADECPECRVSGPVASLAARQVAGIDLPTRSVHPLGALRPTRERSVRPARRPHVAADLLAYTTLLALLTAAVWLVRLAARAVPFTLPRASIAHDGLDLAVGTLAWATAAGAALSLLAVVIGAGRAITDRVRYQGSGATSPAAPPAEHRAPPARRRRP